MIHSPESGIKPDTSDPERIAELEVLGILDTAPEEGFDDAVQIARTICGAPVALISLVTIDRQWFKARAGFPPCETDLNSSVCVYALSEPDLLVIPDLADDPRTRHNPLVTGEPYVRFYAGAPLRTTSGKVMGSLCVLDHEPRPDGLNDEQAEALRGLARQVMILLRERSQLARLQSEEATARAASVRRAALVELGDHLRDVTSVSEMAARAAEIVGQTLNVGRAGYGELDTNAEFVTVFEDWAGPGMVGLAGRHRFADYGEVGSMVQRGEPVVIRAIDADPLTADHAAAFAALGIAAMLNVPVRERGRTVGLFFVHSATTRTWTSEEAAFARNVADRLRVGIARLRAEEQQEVLNRELGHRMKNTLAMVQAIATQTMRNAANLDHARNALAARLMAMGKAHDLLLDGTRESADLEAVIRAALTIHDDGQADRLRFDGPAVHVAARAAMSLSLMIHELATNAAKYGALSTSSGFVSVTWSIAEEAGEAPILSFRWTERGGPAVTPPTRRGFGSRLIERGLAGSIGGSVRMQFPPEGLICELSAPLAGITTDG